jgi:hypothetical protein
VVLHLLPLSAFDVPEPQVDLVRAERDYRGLLNPIGGLTGDSPRYNIDGLLRVTTLREVSEPLAYAQLFRNGVVETASTDIVKTNYIPDTAFEGYVLNAASGYLELQERLGATTPVFAILSLLGVRGYSMRSVGFYQPTHFWTCSSHLSMNQLCSPRRGSCRSSGRQIVKTLSFGCLFRAVLTEWSIWLHWFALGVDRKNFACHPHSSSPGSVQKHSTPASGAPLRTNLEPGGTCSYSAS